MRLLVAENDPALAAFLHSSFDAEHYTVDLTRNGEEARRAMANIIRSPRTTQRKGVR